MCAKVQKKHPQHLLFSLGINAKCQQPDVDKTAVRTIMDWFLFLLLTLVMCKKP